MKFASLVVLLALGTACGTSELDSPLLSVMPQPIVVADAGPDAGVDAGIDAGVDAGVGAGIVYVVGKKWSCYGGSNGGSLLEVIDASNPLKPHDVSWCGIQMDPFCLGTPNCAFTEQGPPFAGCDGFAAAGSTGVCGGLVFLEDTTCYPSDPDGSCENQVADTCTLLDGGWMGVLTGVPCTPGSGL